MSTSRQALSNTSEARRAEGATGCVERIPAGQVTGRDAKELELLPCHQVVGLDRVQRRSLLEVGEHREGVGGAGLDQPAQRSTGGHHRHQRPAERAVVGKSVDRRVVGGDQPFEARGDSRGRRRTVDGLSEVQLPHRRHGRAG